jgi:Domain of unknown function (DUF4271)
LQRNQVFVKHIVFLFFLFVPGALLAQLPLADSGVTGRGLQPVAMDSTVIQRAAPGADTVTGRQPGDSMRPVQVMPADSPFSAAKGRLMYRDVLTINPYYNFFGPPLNAVARERQHEGNDALFYIFAGLLFFFALVKSVFNKYVNNLLGLVFRGSLRQKQIREQLLQTPLPSLLLNIFFVLVAGLYIFFLVQHYKTNHGAGFWLLLFYCVLAVALVYLVKFLVLKCTGWIFNMRDAADTYIFIVFLVNKLLAIFLLPLLIMMVFSMSSWTNSLLTLSYIMVCVFFAYRYLVSFAPVRREVKVSQFHFFMYLCAFEIIPLLLIYKVLLRFF